MVNNKTEFETETDVLFYIRQDIRRLYIASKIKSQTLYIGGKVVCYILFIDSNIV